MSGSSRPGDREARSIDVMRSEIATIPSVIETQRDGLRAPIHDYVSRLDLRRAAAPEIILTGCGDPHFAGLATRLAFERYAGIRCRAPEALECARYEARYVPVDPRPPVLVAVSYSGEVGRTIEAAATAARFGWQTLALTGNRRGRLASSTSDVIVVDVPTLGFSPGTSTYVAILVALYVLAAEIALARSRVEEAGAIEDALRRVPELAAQTIANVEEAAQRVGEAWATSSTATFLGAGPSKATAAFGAAKLFEGPQRYGVVQDLEEWAHEQYFVSGPQTPVTLVAPAGPSRSRAGELLAEMAFVGTPATLVSDVVDDDVASLATEVLPWARGIDEPFSPLLACLPLSLAAYFLAAKVGATSYGFPSEEHRREHYETIHRVGHEEPA